MKHNLQFIILLLKSVPIDTIIPLLVSGFMVSNAPSISGANVMIFILFKLPYMSSALFIPC